MSHDDLSASASMLLAVLRRGPKTWGRRRVSAPPPNGLHLAAPPTAADSPLPFELRPDPAAPRGDLTAALAELLLARTRRTLAAKAAGSATANGRRREGSPP
jgi:hypothetical protein